MISSIGSFLITVLTIYGFILSLRIILSWISLPPSKFTFYLNKITDPVLIYARRILPIKIGIFDISILLPFLVIALLNEIIWRLMISGNPLTFYLIVVLILIAIKLIESFIFWIFLISAGVIIILEIFKVYANNPLISSLHSLLEPVTRFMSSLFTIKSKDAKLIYIVIFVIALIIAHILFNSFMNWLIPFFN